jgi:hypothetical protein
MNFDLVFINQNKKNIVTGALKIGIIVRNCRFVSIKIKLL